MFKGRMKNRAGFVIIVTVIFSLVFAVLLMLYIYLMQRSGVISKMSMFFYEDALIAAHNMALYDIVTDRYKNIGAPRNSLFYALYWKSTGPNKYEAVYKVPVKVNASPASCDFLTLDGNNCVTVYDVSKFKKIKAVYELKSGHWLLTLKEVK